MDIIVFLGGVVIGGSLGVLLGYWTHAALVAGELEPHSDDA